METESANQPESEIVPERTVVGWQGIHFTLPPEWNVTALSMDREKGYLRVDAPGSGTMAVQIRWNNAEVGKKRAVSLASLISGVIRKRLRRPDPIAPSLDLRANLDKMLKETERLGKGKATFESSMKPEKVEGERRSILFSWTGSGRGQGKIWHCSHCNRIVMAQVVGMPKDLHEMGVVASQLFAQIEDHASDGYDLWALYGLEMEVPEDFRLESQKLLSGQLSLVFRRGGERIAMERWGLANMVRKRFSLEEWFKNNGRRDTSRLKREEFTSQEGHPGIRFSGPVAWTGVLAAMRDSKMAMRSLPSKYEGAVWECPATNRLFVLQTLTHARSAGLWQEVQSRCACH